MKVIMGGTFGHLHKGHLKLIKKAFRLGDHVYIGLTTDAYVRKNKPGQGIAGYEERKKKLEEIVDKLGKSYEIKPLNDRFGPSTTGEFDIIVVSGETYHTALDINKLREGKGLKPLKIVKVGYVYAKDSRPISSTRIRNGEIDESGNLKLG